jgi:hypothetical protein
MHIRQTAPDTVVVESELFVVNAKQMQDRCVKIMPRNGSFDCLPANFIGVAKRETRLESGTGHPTTEAVTIVISPGTNLIGSRLCKRSATELRREQDECVLQHAALLEILQ